MSYSLTLSGSKTVNSPEEREQELEEVREAVRAAAATLREKGHAHLYATDPSGQGSLEL